MMKHRYAEVNIFIMYMRYYQETENRFECYTDAILHLRFVSVDRRRTYCIHVLRFKSHGHAFVFRNALRAF